MSITTFAAKLFTLFFLVSCSIEDRPIPEGERNDLTEKSSTQKDSKMNETPEVNSNSKPTKTKENDRNPNKKVQFDRDHEKHEPKPEAPNNAKEHLSKNNSEEDGLKTEINNKDAFIEIAASGCPKGSTEFHRNEFGIMCYIKPSSLSGKNIVSDNFGFHVLGIPFNVSNSKPLTLHLVGTSGKPYNPQSGTSSNLQYFSEVLESGSVLTAIAYPNSSSIGSSCGRSGINFCYEANRENIIYGYANVNSQAKSFIKPGSQIALQNSIVSRLKGILTLMDKSELRIIVPQDDSKVQYEKIRISGHSQGAGHAAMLLKNVNFHSGCLFSGPLDKYRTAPTTFESADWIKGGNWKTAINRINAIISLDEKGHDIGVKNLLAIGLEIENYSQGKNSQGNILVVSDPLIPSSDAHSSTVKSPIYSEIRQSACGLKSL